MTSAALPLAGLRVADLTTFLSGPAAARSLAELGADVIRIEPPQGDPTRAGGGQIGTPPSDFYVALHRDRKGVALDLKCEAGRSVLYDLVPHCDVVLENFRPGVTDRLAISYSHLAPLRPGLIYCSVTGYGSDGPLAKQVATDGAVQAFGGVLELSGSAGDFGLPVPLPMVDLIVGATAVQGILAALIARDRTGEGAYVDVSMLESLLSWLSAADREGMLAPPTTLVVIAKDGVALLVQTVMHFHARLVSVLSTITGCEGLASDPRFATREDRLVNRHAYEELARKAFATRTSDEWLTDLGAVSIPVSRIQTIDEALASPHLRDRNALLDLDIPHLGQRTVLAPPMTFNGLRKSSTTPPPAIGEHTEEVLRSVLGYSDAEIDRHRSEGAFGDMGAS